MNAPLTGRRVLVVEDESLVAMLLETILEDMGCTPVGPAATVDDGLKLATCGSARDSTMCRPFAALPSVDRPGWAQLKGLRQRCRAAPPCFKGRACPVVRLCVSCQRAITNGLSGQLSI